MQKISKKIEDERDEARWHVTDEQFLEKRREEEDEKREAVVSNIFSLFRYNFCCRVTYKRIVNMTHWGDELRINQLGMNFVGDELRVN